MKKKVLGNKIKKNAKNSFRNYTITVELIGETKQCRKKTVCAKASIAKKGLQFGHCFIRRAFDLHFLGTFFWVQEPKKKNNPSVALQKRTRIN